MKKLIFVISLVVIIFSVYIPKIYSQWIQQYTGTTAIIRDIEFLNENTGWAVGDGGTCLKTTNGGTNWIQQNNPAGTKPFVSVHIVDVVGSLLFVSLRTNRDSPLFLYREKKDAN